MTEIKYLSMNAVVILTATALAVLLMTTQENYTYTFLAAAAAFVGVRDMAAAVSLKNDK